MNKVQLEQAFDIKLKSARDNWKGKCVFHDERTPSFFIHKELGIANCFGCGKSGSVEGLLSAYKNISLDKARAELDITVEDTLARKIQGPSAVSDIRFYPESWLAPLTKEIHKYVINRGFEKDILIAAGTCYDRAQQRQVFPHRDRQGRLLGAIGRACRQQDPKWYFYWGYDKGRDLYRSPLASEEISSRALRPTFVVEGVFDVLWLAQHNLNAVAILGAQATDFQIQQLRDIMDIKGKNLKNIVIGRRTNLQRKLDINVQREAFYSPDLSR